MGALNPRLVADLRLRRMMAAAYGRRSKPKTKIPQQRWPRAARLAYFMALKGVLADVRAAVDRLLIPQLPRLLALVAAGKPELLRLDAADDLKIELDTISDAVDNVIDEPRAKQIARTVGGQVASFNKDEINKQFQASVGIELLHGEPYLQQHLDLFAQDNARLITSLAADHVNQVSGLVMAAARAGTPVGQLQEQISARFDVAESKAELLARDQVGKLNGELTQLRQSSVGVTEYEWSTSRDERVRTRHQELEGTAHSWDDPPVVDEKTGRRAHPGQDFQCRCTAIPKVDDILNALGLDDSGAGGVPEPTPLPAAKPAPLSFPSGGTAFVLPDEPSTAGLGQPFVLSPLPKPVATPDVLTQVASFARETLTAAQAKSVAAQLPTLDLDSLLQRPADKAEQLGRSVALDLSHHQKDAITYWGEEGYKLMGRVQTEKLLPGDTSGLVAEARRHIERMYEAVAQAESQAQQRGDAPITLYRGISTDSLDTYSKFLTDAEVDFSRLSSWSTDPQAAYEFTGTERYNVMFHVRTAKGLPIASYAPVQTESETILGARRMRVVGRRSVLQSNGELAHVLVELEEM